MPLDDLPQDALRDELRRIASQLDECAHGESAPMVQRECARLGMSKQTLYRRLREVGWTSGRKRRADAGSFTVGDDVLTQVAGLQKVGIRKNGKVVMKIPTAVSVLMMNGIEVDASHSTVARALRAKQMDIRTLQRATPAVEQRSLHPNHVHMVDPSLCLLFYIKGKQHIIDESDFYKNKLDAVAKNPLKVWRYVLVDHTSNAITLRYYERKGEDQHTLADFLLYAWSKIDGRVTHGVPRILMMDPGSANTAHSIRHLLQALDVQMLVNQPKGPRAKGAVEVAQNIVEMNFEARLRVTPVSCVDELNERALAWCAAYCDNRVPGQDTRLKREGFKEPMARYAIWRLIRADQLRLLPPLEACLMLLHGKVQQRKVDGELRISFAHPMAERSMRYDVRGLAGVNAGDVVTVKPLLYGQAAVMIEVARYDGELLSYRLEPIMDYNPLGFRESSPVIGQEFHSLPKTDLERTQDALDRAAYGITPDGEIRDREAIEKAKADKKVVPFGHLNDGKGLDAFSGFKAIDHPLEMPKRGTEIVPATPPIAQPQGTFLEDSGLSLNVPNVASVSLPIMDHVEMAKALQRRLGEGWTPDRFQWLVNEYPDGVTEDRLDEIEARITRLGRMQVINGGSAA